MLTTRAPLPERPAAGIALCIFGLFLFSVQDLIIKFFSGTYSVLQIVFIRGVVAVVPIFIAVLVTSGWSGTRTGQVKMLLARGLLGFFSYLTYYMAIAALPLVEVVTIVFSAPILVTVMSAVVLKEPVGARRWSALLVGFAAIVLVVGPNGDFRHLATVLALLAAFTYACQNLLTRVIGAGEPPWTITLYTMFAFIIGSAVASVLVAGFGAALTTENPSLQFLLRPWVVPPLGDGLLMVFVGLNAALAFYCLAKAYRVSPVSVVAPFEYTYIIWAVVFGYLIWAEIPKATSAVGVLLLVASGFYIFRRELRLSAAAHGQRQRRRRRRFRSGGLPTVDSGGVRQPEAAFSFTTDSEADAGEATNAARAARRIA
ncbi:MAG: DMT family transporter [Gammaproteobacteria bacterium]|nr:DMT family transporter [Gammaproteobacteria bacterium]MDD9874484.1 DMT family transporter [Gammaproteobacteria bacterium]